MTSPRSQRMQVLIDMYEGEKETFFYICICKDSRSLQDSPLPLFWGSVTGEANLRSVYEFKK